MSANVSDIPGFIARTAANLHTAQGEDAETEAAAALITEASQDPVFKDDFVGLERAEERLEHAADRMPPNSPSFIGSLIKALSFGAIDATAGEYDPDDMPLRTADKVGMAATAVIDVGGAVALGVFTPLGFWALLVGLIALAISAYVWHRITDAHQETDFKKVATEYNAAIRNFKDRLKALQDHVAKQHAPPPALPPITATGVRLRGLA